MQRRRKVFQLPDDQTQLVLQRSLRGDVTYLFLQGGNALFEALYPWLEVVLLNQPIRIRVDQSPHALSKSTDLGVETGQIIATAVLPRVPQATLILLLEPLWLLEQRADFLPHRGIHQIRSHLGVITEPVAAEAVGVSAGAPVVGVVADMAFGCTRADRLAVVSVATAGTADEALEQVASAARSLPCPPTILGQLLLNYGKEILADQGRHGDADLLLGWDIHGRDGAPGLHRAAALDPLIAHYPA
jgi:hypothetical protein